MAEHHQGGILRLQRPPGGHARCRVEGRAGDIQHRAAGVAPLPGEVTGHQGGGVGHQPLEAVLVHVGDAELRGHRRVHQRDRRAQAGQRQVVQQRGEAVLDRDRDDVAGLHALLQVPGGQGHAVVLQVIEREGADRRAAQQGQRLVQVQEGFVGRGAQRQAAIEEVATAERGIAAQRLQGLRTHQGAGGTEGLGAGALGQLGEHGHAQVHHLLADGDDAGAQVGTLDEHAVDDLAHDDGVVLVFLDVQDEEVLGLARGVVAAQGVEHRAVDQRDYGFGAEAQGCQAVDRVAAAAVAEHAVDQLAGAGQQGAAARRGRHQVHGAAVQLGVGDVDAVAAGQFLGEVAGQRLELALVGDAAHQRAEVAGEVLGVVVVLDEEVAHLVEADRAVAAGHEEGVGVEPAQQPLGEEVLPQRREHVFVAGTGGRRVVVEVIH